MQLHMTATLVTYDPCLLHRAQSRLLWCHRRIRRTSTPPGHKPGVQRRTAARIKPEKAHLRYCNSTQRTGRYPWLSSCIFALDHSSEAHRLRPERRSSPSSYSTLRMPSVGYSSPTPSRYLQRVPQICRCSRSREKVWEGAARNRTDPIRCVLAAHPKSSSHISARRVPSTDSERSLDPCVHAPSMR
ncbi:uncharacterized protein SCHCODRAFT_02080312 [Schizophyllum commune H4-8]|uniref:uncharacterized protein n=1 Tax=Schizophyllum commune (strain H4-8 / FGSC 9210) TaxID=578458 RepID=UPI0021610301|nr:uncharacterized protein SCHCODRAFT_02080312 [Schizophyllum commune H4-8]KAI5886749.1 hypothetical protein SCHCODRAFT_02080312 [Schizophyllum commune H4-8]